jgi:hypothetical protein
MQRCWKNICSKRSLKARKKAAGKIEKRCKKKKIYHPKNCREKNAWNIEMKDSLIEFAQKSFAYFGKSEYQIEDSS